MCQFDAALRARYGAWSGLRQYVEEAQAQDYENTRAQFEAFIDHANNTPLPSTGTIYWQMNKGWPSLLWTLYGSDGDQAGSYFGAQEANRSLHALYALDNGTVTVDNLGGRTETGLSVQAKVYSLAGKVLYDRTVAGITLASQQVRTKVLTPKVAVRKPARVYFVELVLRQHGALADRNVYWLSTQGDVVNWRKTLDHPQGLMTRYADLRSLQALPTSRVRVTATTSRRAEARRCQPGHHRPDHRHVGIDGRVPAARRRAARHQERPRDAGRQRTAVLNLAGQRHHAVPR